MTTSSQSTVLIRSAKAQTLDAIVADILQYYQASSRIHADSRVVIKPNLCSESRSKIAHANTDHRLLECVCRQLKEFTEHVVVGESDGIRAPAELAMEESGVFELAKTLDLQVVNFSKDRLVDTGHKMLQGFGLPATLLEADYVVTLPVLKTHALTVFSGAIKNQWGCVPRYDRILLHKYLDQLLCDLNGLLKPSLAIMDGLICVEGRGPVNGKPREVGAILASDDLVALDATAMRLVGLEPRESRHIVLSHEGGFGQLEESGITVDGPFDEFACQFEPAVLDWAIRAMNYCTRSSFFTKKILMNDRIFQPTKQLVNLSRKIGLVR